jgi:dTDP-glucose 4,6-dehydratase
MDENHPTDPPHPYGASKLAADRMALSMHRIVNLPVVIIRSFNTYGPRQSARAVIPSAITQGLTQGRVGLSNLRSTRDFMHVSDAVAGLVRAAEAPEAVGQVVNLGTGQELAVREVGEMVVKALGSPDMLVMEDVSAARPEGAEVKRLCADSRKAKALLGWEAKVLVYQGILTTAEWFRENLHLYPKAGRRLI